MSDEQALDKKQIKEQFLDTMDRRFPRSAGKPLQVCLAVLTKLFPGISQSITEWKFILYLLHLLNNRQLLYNSRYINL